MHLLETHWQRNTLLSLVLAPLAWLYGSGMWLRRWLYKLGIFASMRLPVPVIIVGNITVGGTGKTPLVLWLCETLRAAGYRPGIVSRGYGGKASTWPQVVTAQSDPGQVGDEPVLLARRSGCPVVVGPQRVVDAELLYRAYHCDVIVADDGLQHYRLQRDIEIAVIDGQRRFGNGRCLPAGPLREPLSRLQQVALRVTNGEAAANEWPMHLQDDGFYNLRTGERRELAAFVNQAPVHALAGIGHPERFFQHLRALGIAIHAHAFPDHHRFQPADLEFADGGVVIMTEKDAVKCESFATSNHWYLAVVARLDTKFAQTILKLLREEKHG